MNTFTNPVLKGFSPDPSVCGVGEDFYLVTSTFAYFPGVPIYHSKDLVNWTQIGNVLERDSQLPLDQAGHSQGIFAPCLRYHEGTFYMITTNVTHGGNFVVTATDPKGPWSDPYYLEDAPGIDPSLFFDEDGRCYYVGTRPNPKGVTYNGDWEVWLQELDLNTMRLIGVSTSLWKGAMRDVVWPEGPHLYKKDGYYYLMIAEGGTGFNHCVTIARSQQVAGPYLGNPNNPILTHRHLGKDFPVCNVGHGDLVETTTGKWYMTCLASRNYEGYSNLGRETFLAEVVWEDGWPVVNPGNGQLLDVQEHALPLSPVPETSQFSLAEENVAFVYLRNPHPADYNRAVRPGWLRLTPGKATLSDVASPTYIGLRQKAMNYHFRVDIQPSLAKGEACGLALIQSNDYHVRLEITETENGYLAQLIRTLAGVEETLGRTTFTGDRFVLQFTGALQQLTAKVIVAEEEHLVAEAVAIHYLSTEIAGGFVGCTMGLYATRTAPQATGYVDAYQIEHQVN
jgi:xylan 1,4-beta-xylosidase